VETPAAFAKNCGKLINLAKEKSPTSHEYLNNACLVGLEAKEP